MTQMRDIIRIATIFACVVKFHFALPLVSGLAENSQLLSLLFHNYIPGMALIHYVSFFYVKGHLT